MSRSCKGRATLRPYRLDGVPSHVREGQGRGSDGGGAVVGPVHSHDDRLRAGHGARPYQGWSDTIKGLRKQ